MKALAVFPGTKKVQLVDHPEPRLEKPDEVRVRILDVGVCGTDREIITFTYGTPPPGSDYLILGHENLGEVLETGPEVEGLKAGDLVVTSVRRPCSRPDCPACREGRSDFCYTGEYTERGIKGLHGYMTEVIVDQERYMSRLPGELRDVGVLIEPLTIAEKALIQIHDIQDRLPWGCNVPADANGAAGDHSCHRALVLGAGPVGLLGAMVFKAAGFDTWIYSRTRSASGKQDLARSFGARFVDSEKASPEQLLEEMGQIDCVYEAVGGAPVAFEILKLLGANGVFVFTGVPGRKAPVPLDVQAILTNMVLRNQAVIGTVNAGPGAFTAAVRDLGQFMKLWPDAVRQLITKRVSLDEAPELLSGDWSGIKNVVSPAAAP